MKRKELPEYDIIDSEATLEVVSSTNLIYILYNQRLLELVIYEHFIAPFDKH